jgi:putative transport protein
MELLKGDTVAHSILILSLVASVGVFLGSLRIYGITMGIAGVLFSGLFFGHFQFTIDPHVLDFVRDFGLILFVYTIGMQVGPGFVASLRRQGLPLNLMAVAIVLLGVAITVGIVLLGGIDMSAAVGLFAGATTNTPALGAAQQALKNLPSFTDQMGKMPGLGYAVAYPFGVIGIILAMGLVRAFFRVNVNTEAAEFAREMQSATSKLTNANLVVTNENLNGLPISKIPGLEDSGVIISRVLENKQVHVATPDTILHTNDIVHLVGTQDSIDSIKVAIGQDAKVDLMTIPSHITSRRVLVTQKSIPGQTLEELDLQGRFEVTATRVSRADIEFTPKADLRLQFADTLLLVGEAEDIDRAAKELGNSPKQLNHPQILPIFVGIALGIIFGSWPVHLGTMPAPVKLGLAGGPLIIAIILSRIGRIGPLIYYMPLSANFMLREMGIVLFLSCVGLKAGDQFMATLLQGPGFYWMGCAALITIVPLLIVGFIARAIYKLNYMSLIGVLAGSMTDPPALAFANTVAASDAPSVSYATVYPLTMLLRVLCAQLLVIFFLS